MFGIRDIFYATLVSIMVEYWSNYIGDHWLRIMQGFVLKMVEVIYLLFQTKSQLFNIGVVFSQH